MRKEYLDRKEIEEIFIKAVNYKNSYKFTEKELSNIITKIYQLKPKNQVVIAEGKIYSGWDSWNIGDYYSYEFKEFLDKHSGKRGKLIFMEEE